MVVFAQGGRAVVQSNGMVFVRVVKRLVLIVGVPLVLLLLLVDPFLLLGVSGTWLKRLSHLAQIAVFSFLLVRWYGWRESGLRFTRTSVDWWGPFVLVGSQLVCEVLLLPVVAVRTDWHFLVPQFFYLLLFNAASEELLFRGWLYNNVAGATRRRMVVAALATSVLFWVVSCRITALVVADLNRSRWLSVLWVAHSRACCVPSDPCSCPTQLAVRHGACAC